MGNILTTTQAITLSKNLRESHKRIVLAGGCFDILHKGHVAYLSQAKHKGNILFVLLESDDSIRSSKGRNRPIHSQQDRAYILSHLSDVDYIITLSGKLKNEDYDKLIFSLKPDIIATTKGDPHVSDKIRQAEKIKAQVVDVVDKLEHTSTSQLADLLSKEL